MIDKLALPALLLILIVVNGAIVGKENHLAQGKLVYLELAPVDPRSLMQGDYMALRFDIAEEVRNALPRAEQQASWPQQVEASDGYVVVRLDERNIGSFQRLHTEPAAPLAENEILMRYRVRNGIVKFATNAFFFQEGHADRYQSARYGQFRVDDKGELLLAQMHDEQLLVLGTGN